MKHLFHQKRGGWQGELRRLRRRKIKRVPMAIYAEGTPINPAWRTEVSVSPPFLAERQEPEGEGPDPERPLICKSRRHDANLF